jgi:hypothetical protein
MMKRPDVITRVTRLQQAQKALQVLKVIQTMKFRCMRLNAAQEGSQLRVRSYSH